MREYDVDDAGNHLPRSRADLCPCCGVWELMQAHTESCASREITDVEVEALAAQAIVDFDWIRLEEGASDSRAAAHGRLVLSQAQDRMGVLP